MCIVHYMILTYFCRWCHPPQSQDYSHRCSSHLCQYTGHDHYRNLFPVHTHLGLKKSTLWLMQFNYWLANTYLSSWIHCLYSQHYMCTGNYQWCLYIQHLCGNYLVPEHILQYLHYDIIISEPLETPLKNTVLTVALISVSSKASVARTLITTISVSTLGIGITTCCSIGTFINIYQENAVVFHWYAYLAKEDTQLMHQQWE